MGQREQNKNSLIKPPLAVASSAQRRMWLVNQLEKPNASYNIPCHITLRGHIDIVLLQQSFDLLLERHSALRTSFTNKDGEPLQEILPRLNLNLPVEDISGLEESDKRRVIAEIVQTESEFIFDLNIAPLLRAKLIQTRQAHPANDSAEEFVLVIVLHHIISDGWSMGVLSRDLFALYDHLKNDAPMPAKLPLQYIDYSKRQQQNLESETTQKQFTFWEEQLKDMSLLELPTDFSRPRVKGSKGANVISRIDASLSASLRRLSERESVTTNMLLSTAFGLLLHRYTNQNDIVFGAPVANRNQADIEGLIGCFVNVLVIRNRIDDDQIFTEFLRQSRENLFTAYANQEVPFESLVDALQPERDRSRNPLFQVAFAMQNEPMPAIELKGLSIGRPIIPGYDNSEYGVEAAFIRFDVELHCWDTEAEIRCSWIYDVALFKPATIEAMSQHFVQLLEAIVKQPDSALGKLSMLGEQERRQILVDWNHTATNYPREQTVQALFESQAATTPEAVALDYDSKQLSYNELNQRANRLAHYLRRQGVCAEVKVGLFMERSPEMVVAVLGILKSGGAYVPLDLDYPSSRIAFMLDDAQVPVLVSTSNLIARLPEQACELVCVDRDWAKIGQERADNPEIICSADSLAYVIYTSGSTGTPKGVEIPHRAINRLVKNTDYYQADATDRIAQASSISFDAATFELWGALLNGAQLVGIDKNTLLNSNALATLLQEKGVTAMFMTTAVFNQIAREVPNAFDGLRAVMFGGEAVDPGAVRRVLASHPPQRLLHVYGPTESTTFATWYPIESVAEDATTIPIGRPLANTTLYVLDANRSPVPVGVSGELYIGGDGLARGYLNRPELSAERFVANPFDASSKLYRTGDKVRYLADGSIEFQGRFDHQIKLRGFRIELGEIETALVNHETLQDAVAIVREDEPGDKRIAAYLVASPEWVEQISSSQSVEHVDEWQALYEETYGDIDESLDLTTNFTGWNISYTGAPIAAAEMQEWVDATVVRIGALQPRRVLEIGCGTGLLLYRLAPGCDRYVGTDFSAVAQEQVRSMVTARESHRHVELWQRMADDFSDIEGGDFDTVIINSVTQYLPSMDYLAGVIENSVDAIVDGGRLMLGDIRSLPLLKAYHTSVQLYLSPDEASGGELLRKIQQHVEEENELVIEPAFFHALKQRIPRLSHVEVLLKQGQYHNELTGYRYDVLLHVEATTEALPENGQWLDWGVAGLDEVRLRDELNTDDRDWLGISAIPNARVFRDVAVLEQLQGEGSALSVGELRQSAESTKQQVVEPDVLWHLAEKTGYQLELSYTGAGTDGRMNALFRRSRREDCAGYVFWPQHQEVPERAWSAYGTNSLKVRLGNELILRLRQDLQRHLPEYMLPTVYVVLDGLPLNSNGKVDRNALPAPDHLRRVLCGEYIAPRDSIEQKLAEIWQQLLHVEQVGIHDNFFELGGHSLMLLQVRSKLQEILRIRIPVVSLFQFPDIESLARHLSGKDRAQPILDEACKRADRRLSGARANAIAIIGMVGRFPGAPDLESFWANLRNGVESISFFNESELRSAGIDERLLADPNYVPARGVLTDAELFDAWFFGYTPREAEQMDPQQRIFLECAWEVLENAGYDSHRYAGLIGVYAGSGRSIDLTHIRGADQSVAGLSSALAGDRDFLPTRVSYKLDLHGPSVNVQTACSTSLVAVHQACRALLDHDCDMALAGGVSILASRVGGYMHRQSDITSPDGHCRAFDVDSAGTVGGEGVGLVLLKRLDEAMADGDVIHAVIRGTAVNNDGASKVGFTAPSVEWQAKVVALAQAVADVQPDAISYVESHGTGTALGDPIEIAALTQAFDTTDTRRQPCAIGALKPNIGHLGEAAGIAGLIKTVLALKHRELVPTVHYHQPNPEIDFETGSFFVNSKLRPWVSRDGEPRRAGVSAFGIGGTNAHAVVEEASLQSASMPSRDCQLLILSAKTTSALDDMSLRLAGCLEASPALCLGDVAYTLQRGRRQFGKRRTLVCRSTEEAVASLRGQRGLIWSGEATETAPEVLFVFPGQGAQYVNMGRNLYQQEPVFRDVMDACCEQLEPHLGLDLRTVLYPPEHAAEACNGQLERTSLAQPALFVLGYALARLWMAWGIRPAAMMGHSVGEYIAACLADVMSLDSALAVVAERGRLMAELPPGSMLAIGLPEAKLKTMLDGELSIASINGPESCVASGPTEAVDRLTQRLSQQGVACHLLRTSHAFHSAMMEPALEAFAARLEDVKFATPKIPYVSNVTGEWIKPEQAMSPQYYCRHLRTTVRFWKGFETLTAKGGGIPLEVGPGGALAALRNANLVGLDGVPVLASLGDRAKRRSDIDTMQEALGGLWIAGVEPDWLAVHGDGRRCKVELPTYPFERYRYWTDPAPTGGRSNDFESPLAPPRERAESDRAGQADGASQSVPGHRRPSSCEQLVYPSSETESTLVQMLETLLGYEPIGVEDNFFDLGISSLLAIEFAANLREFFATELSIGTIFDAPTVRALGAVLDSQGQEATDANLDALLNEIENLTPEELQAQLDEAQIRSNERPQSIGESESDGHVSSSMRDIDRSSIRGAAQTGRMDFSLFFFSADGSKTTPDKYHLLLECARFADRQGFSAIWTPERHFQAFGGLYPNPSVLSAALAMITETTQIRAGSIVAPLHHPIRIAEDWALVDNLSNGRVGISLASGWHPQDFVLGQVPHEERKQYLFRQVQTLRDLWAGEAVSFRDQDGHQHSLSIRPRPLQETIPIWISIAGNPETWARTAEVNANVLTTLGYISFDDLEVNIRAYRAALRHNGHDPGARTVTVMLHTFLGDSNDQVRQLVREPMIRYLKGFVKQKDSIFGPSPVHGTHQISETDEQGLLDVAFARYFDGMALFGTPEKCAVLIERLLAIGVDEVACLVDFGLGEETILDGLTYLDQLRGTYDI